MFENIIEQGAARQLKDDILSRRLAPSMLFFGPSESGKGSAAVELARVLSCESDASWKCACPACERHRYLQHSDLLMLGFRSFTSEIAACHSAFSRNPLVPSTKILFLRSIRKLQMRFSPVLMEDDPKLGKLSSVLQSLEEGLNEFWVTGAEFQDTAAFEKLCGSIVKNANILADEGIGRTIPVGHIRKAAYWCRLAPNGKRKTLIIENADNMREEARNSLLKLLEEPPQTVSIILTSKRREAIMPTILSRMRPYRFLKRSPEGEVEIIRRVFQASVNQENGNGKTPAAGSLISAYLGSFLSGGTEKLYPLAAWFISSLARAAAAYVKKTGAAVPLMITALGERYAPIAGEAGFERTTKSSVIAKKVIEETGSSDDDSFSRFLSICLDMVSVVTREADDPRAVAYNDMFKKYIGEAETAVNTLNISAPLALEALFYKLRKSMAGSGFVYG